jgi:threonine dehydratase
VSALKTTVNYQDVVNAEKLIRQIVPITPIKHSSYLSAKFGKPIYLKLENLNKTGSFKIRGACNALLQKSKTDLARGVVCASAGNHAQGVAFMSQVLGAKATIFMPEHAPLVKVASTQMLGASVVLHGSSYDDAFQAAQDFAAKSGAVFVHAYADPEVIAGQGTIGLEIAQQVPDVSTVITSVGGGGLLAGLSCALKHLKPNLTIIGAQSAAFPALLESAKLGTVVTTGPGQTIADGIAVRTPAEITVDIARRFVSHLVLVQEKSIMTAILELAEQDHVLAEGAGAAGVASLYEHGLMEASGPIVVVICGGNIDLQMLTRIIPQGLRMTGRLMRFKTTITDRPGRLVQLLGIISKCRANLLEVEHNRMFSGTGYDQVEIQVDVETTDESHQELLVKDLRTAGFEISRG